jgi:Legionella pneumophila major outer membrane protein precursor
MKLNRVVWCAVAVLALQGIAPATKASDQDAIVARLNALERENAALRQRLNRLERAEVASRHTAPQAAGRQKPLQSSALETPGKGAPIMDARAQGGGMPEVYKGQDPGIGPWIAAPHFEVSGSLLFLQPGAGNLEYGTLVTPFPVASPNWSNQSLTPNFSPAFRLGARYMPNEANDIELNWTHQNSAANGSFSAAGTQMVGPPYLIGPESALYKIANGNVQSNYDSINFDGGHTFCAECSFQLRVFGGVEAARIGQNLSGLFQSTDGLASSANTTTSLFTGAGPRLGMKGQYALGDFQLIGEAAAAALIGTAQSRINFSTTSPTLVGNNQSLTSPNATQVIPSIDARLAAAYAFPATNYGVFRIEAGWQAAVYFNAVNQYSLTQVPTSLMLPPVGVFLATAQRVQSSFTDQGPYLTGSWAF